MGVVGESGVGDWGGGVAWMASCSWEISPWQKSLRRWRKVAVVGRLLGVVGSDARRSGWMICRSFQKGVAEVRKAGGALRV